MNLSDLFTLYNYFVDSGNKKTYALFQLSFVIFVQKV